jgi:hypothetical protein
VASKTLICTRSCSCGNVRQNLYGNAIFTYFCRKSGVAILYKGKLFKKTLTDFKDIEKRVLSAVLVTNDGNHRCLSKRKSGPLLKKNEYEEKTTEHSCWALFSFKL